MIVDNLIRPEVLAEVVGELPARRQARELPPGGGVVLGPLRDTHATRCTASSCADLVGERLGMDLKDRPPMLTIRGRTGPKDGQIHTDSKSKLVTVLLVPQPRLERASGAAAAPVQRPRPHPLRRRDLAQRRALPDLQGHARTAGTGTSPSTASGAPSSSTTSPPRKSRDHDLRAPPLQRLPERAVFEERCQESCSLS